MSLSLFDPTGQVTIISDGNCGIGLAIPKWPAAAGELVGLAARQAAKAEKAIAKARGKMAIVQENHVLSAGCYSSSCLPCEA